MKITTHVLDTSRGRPADGVPVVLEKEAAGGFSRVGAGKTGVDGRCGGLVDELTVGTWRLVFDTATYFRDLGVEGFYPSVTIVFVVRDASQHHHVPLLLSPFGYSTYRGS
jgi:5-hydroxyisourate hydrolase